MRPATPATHRLSTSNRPRSHTHHMHVYRSPAKCWVWECPCGGGIHSVKGLPNQRAAFVAALLHFTGQAGG